MLQIMINCPLQESEFTKFSFVFFFTLSQGADYYSTATYDPKEKGNTQGKSYDLPMIGGIFGLWHRKGKTKQSLVVY